MAITFYWAPRSSATRIYWALEELQIPHEKVRIDFASGDQKKPDYVALNPNGKVPLLVDNGTPIFESMAILIHLGLSYAARRKVSGPRRGRSSTGKRSRGSCGRRRRPRPSCSDT